jgi:Tfp pilus assembly protein PilO
MKSRQIQNTPNNGLRIWWKQTTVRLVMTIIATAFAVGAAYLGTINELKLSLAEKADRRAVEKIDLRLARIEVLINEHLPTKDEFHQLRDALLVRLARIESELGR